MSHPIPYDNENRVGNGLDDFDTYQVKTEIIKHGGSHNDLVHSPGGHSRHGHNHSHSEHNLASHHHRLGENAVPALVQAFSGAVGSSIANVAVHPLDIIVKRLQVQRHIQNQICAERRAYSGATDSSPRRHTPSLQECDVTYKAGGRPRSRGESPEKLILGMGDRGDRYTGQTEEHTEHTEHSMGTHYSRTYSSSSSHVIGLVETLEEQGHEYVEQYHGIVDCAQKIWAEEGLGGFYTGIVEETIGTLGSAFWYFAAYSYIRNKRLHKRHTQKLPVLEELLIGLVAGSASRIFLTPFNTIATRKQTHAMLYPNVRAPGIVQIYHEIMREKGITGFWSGYSANMFLSLNPSVTFLLYESLKNFAGGNRRRMKGAETFLIAAVAKAIATGLTYPLAVAKSRTQIANEEDGFNLRGITGIGKAGEELRKGILRKKKRAGNVIEVLADIFKKEGIAGLYEGVLGELLRGFVSSGITMVIKESVHRTILSLYYFVMRAYNRAGDHTFHSTTKLMAKDAYDKAGPRQKKLLNKAIEGKHKVAGLIEVGKEKVIGGHHSEETRRHDSMKMKAAAATAVAGLAAGAVHSHRKNERHDGHGNLVAHTTRERVEEWREGVGEDSHRIRHAGHIDDRIHTGETHQDLHQSHSHSGHSGSRTDQFGKTGVIEHTHIEERTEHGQSGGSHGRRGFVVADIHTGETHQDLHQSHSHSGHSGSRTDQFGKTGVIEHTHIEERTEHGQSGGSHGRRGFVVADVVGAAAGATGHKLSSHSHKEHGHSHSGHAHGGDLVTKTTKVVEEFGIVKDPRSTHIKNIHDGHQAVTDSRSRFGETSHQNTSIHEERGRQHGIIGAVTEKIAGHGHSRGRSHSANRHGSSALELAHKATGKHSHGHGHGHRDGQTIIHTSETVQEWRDEANAVEDLRQFGVASTVHEDSRSDFGETLHKGHSIVGHGHTKRFGDDAVHHDHGRTVVEKTQITRINENLHNGGHHNHGHSTHRQGGVVGAVVGATEKIVGHSHSTHGHTHNDSRSNFGSSALHKDGRTIVEKTEVTRINENIHGGGHHSHGHSTHRQGGVVGAIVGAAEKLIGHGQSTHRHNESRSNFGDAALHTDGRTIEKTQITRINENLHDGVHHSQSTHGHTHNSSRSNFGGAALHTDGRTITEKTETVRFGETHHGNHNITPTRSPLSRMEDAVTNKIVEKTQTTRFGETHHDAGHQHHHNSSSSSHNSGIIAAGKAALGLDNTRTTTTHRETSSGSGWLGKKALGNASINTAAATAGSNGVTTVTRTEEFWPVDEDARSSVYNFLDEETKEVGGVSIETRTAEEKWWDDKRGKGYN